MTKKSLHIIFLNSWYPSRVLPQNGDFIQRHAEAVALQHQVTAVHVITDPDIQENELTDENIKGVRTLIYYLKPQHNFIKKQMVFYKKYLELIKLSGNFDLIHVNRTYPAGIVALYLKKKKNIPYIVTEHFTGYLVDQSKNLSATEHLLTKQITRNAAFVCPVSQDLANNMQKLGFKGNYRIIPNVVDTELFYPLEQKKYNSFTLIHISSLDDNHKNIKGILRVIRRLQDEIPDFKFLLIGPNSIKYDDFISKTGIKPTIIEKTGMIPHRKIPEYLKKSDVLLQFSRYENLPCVILEAFACGIPVISSDVGGIKEFFPTDFGKLIEKEDEESLFNAILEIYRKRNNFKSEKMHLYALKHFGKESIAKAYNQIYYEILNLKP